MGLSREDIARALRSVPGPGGVDLVTGKRLIWSSVCDSYAAVKLQIPDASPGPSLDQLSSAVHGAITRASAAAGTPLDSLIVEYVNDAGTVVASRRFGGVQSSSQQSGPPSNQPSNQPSAQPSSQPPASAGHTPIPGLAPRPAGQSLPGIGRIIAVGAGKGGVGKSTVALNLAVGFARRGHAVGLLDGDIYGPSMPTMLGLGAMEATVHAGSLQPFVVHGVKCMTIGKLVDPEKPLIWRGPMAHGAFKQLAEQTRWGELDYLVIDLPPGTGDVALTMAQMLRLSGAVIVCTPQKVAQDDAVRAAGMFRQLGVEVLGVVENMSHFVGDDGKVYDIFGKGGAETMAQRLGVPFLGAIPITMSLRVHSDAGDPTANFEGKDPAGVKLREALDALVTNLEGQVALASVRSGGPTLTIS